jgi:hypothetical protein
MRANLVLTIGKRQRKQWRCLLLQMAANYILLVANSVIFSRQMAPQHGVCQTEQ